MKTREKIWKTKYQDIDIYVKNAWDFGHVCEEIHINGKKVYFRNTRLDEVSFKSAMGLRVDWVENNTEITVKIGSAWHFCGMACQILVNGKYYYGNRIVWFADKALNE